MSPVWLSVATLLLLSSLAIAQEGATSSLREGSDLHKWLKAKPIETKSSAAAAAAAAAARAQETEIRNEPMRLNKHSELDHFDAWSLGLIVYLLISVCLSAASLAFLLCEKANERALNVLYTRLHLKRAKVD